MKRGSERREKEEKRKDKEGMEKGVRGEEIDSIVCVCVTVSHRDNCGC